VEIKMTNILETKRDSLLEIAKYHINEMKQSNEFDLEDFQKFSDMLIVFEELEKAEFLPHLAIAHMNMWYAFMDFFDEVMYFLGYEEVGRMANDFGEVKYKFESKDITYDCLYRLKSNNADYTKTIKLNYDK
jgi:hypothetical protein